MTVGRGPGFSVQGKNKGVNVSTSTGSSKNPYVVDDYWVDGYVETYPNNDAPGLSVQGKNRGLQLWQT